MLDNILYIALAFFALGFSIFIHELGHFIAAKKRGLKADRFSIGFGPRLFGWHWNGTDFRLSLIPLGGYVSLPQLADMGRLEGGEEKEVDQLPPISYADKVIVAVMGAVFNMIFAFVLSLVLWGIGREVIKTTTIGQVDEIVVNTLGEPVPGPAYSAGLIEGDVITTVDGTKVRDWMHFQNILITGVGREQDGKKRPQVELGVERDGQLLDLIVYPELRRIATDELRFIGIGPELEKGSSPVVTDLVKGMPAIEAGLKKGDRILKLDGNEIVSSAYLSVYLEKNGGRTIDVAVLRGDQELVVPIKPRFIEKENRKLFGFQYYYDFKAKTEIVHVNPAEQIVLFADTMRRTLYALVHKDSNVAVKNMSGPAGIVHGLKRMAEVGFVDLLWMLALINVNLAIFNLLPIPVLDGGHIFFATVSKVIGRPLPRRLMENVQGAFMIFLLSFVVYVTFFDISRIGYDMGLIKDEPVKVVEPTDAVEEAEDEVE